MYSAGVHRCWPVSDVLITDTVSRMSRILIDEQTTLSSEQVAGVMSGRSELLSLVLFTLSKSDNSSSERPLRGQTSQRGRSRDSLFCGLYCSVTAGDHFGQLARFTTYTLSIEPLICTN